MIFARCVDDWLWRPALAQSACYSNRGWIARPERAASTSCSALISRSMLRLSALPRTAGAMHRSWRTRARAAVVECRARALPNQLRWQWSWGRACWVSRVGDADGAQRDQASAARGGPRARVLHFQPPEDGCFLRSRPESRAPRRLAPRLVIRLLQRPA